MAATITLVPVGHWLGCGAPEPDCEALRAARAAGTPEETAARLAERKARNLARAAVRGGLGTELKAILADLGLVAANGCGCDARAAQMNAWGIAGCREHRDEIVGWLRREQARLGWLATIQAAARALSSGLAFHLDLADPAPGLLDEAIRRAGG